MNLFPFRSVLTWQSRSKVSLPKVCLENKHRHFRMSQMRMPIKHSWQRKIALVAAAAVLATAVGIAPACLAAEALYDGNGTPQPTSQPLVVTVPPASSGTEGSPDGIVSNGGSDFEVSPGSSSVVPAQRQLVNISTRAAIGTGDNVAIAGFIIHIDPPALTGSKRVLLRGLGPSLKVNGVPIPGRLADPFLELHDINGTLIESNDNWMNSPERAAIIASGLAPTDPHESAILRTLIAGTNYTAVLRGVNNTTGIGLVEVYDLEPTNDTHLANISGRGFVSPGDDVLIGGVIIQGDTAEQVLFRALGPSLASRGVSPVLPDPTLDLYDVNGTLIAHNDDWMNSPNKNAIIATGLAPTDPRESAILETLAAGNYTAIVRGKNNIITGNALVEAYRLGPP
jgi:hypothetical protein